MTVPNQETDRSRLERLFLAAVEMPPGEQEAFLDAECLAPNNPNPDLRQTLESLLASERAVRESPDWAGPSGMVSGLRFGPYQVTERIGAGGMGVVYAALRDDAEYARKVAIKAIPPGLFTSPGAAVLRHERQILANLEHPCIARLLDGGTTPEGVPWLAMEYVDGLPLLDYVRNGKLSERDCLHVLLRICDAVAYAHSQLVIHSDIKPSNILVSADGIPHLLDFGIARLMDARDTVTALHARPMTVAWASPEQISGQRMTTASDIYSLGLLLVALSEPDGGRLPGDLRFVADKALAPEPQSRYATVEQFAEDLRCYLDNRPVKARKGSLAYRLRRFVRRHRLPLAFATATVAALGFAVFSQLSAARKLERRLLAERKLANAFLMEIPDSIQSVPGTLAARQLVIRRAVAYLDELALEATEDNDLSAEVAAGYDRIGSFTFDVPTSLALHRKALQMNRRLIEADPTNRAWRQQLCDSLSTVANVLKDAGDTAGSLAASREAAQESRTLCQGAAPEAPCMESLADTTTALAMAMFEAGNPGGAVAELRKAVALLEQRMRLAPTDLGRTRQLMQARIQLTRLLSASGDHSGELAAAQQARAMAEALLRKDPASTHYRRDMWLVNMRIGQYYAGIGNWPAAVTEHQQGLARIQALAEADPGDRGHRRGVALNHLYLGDALAAIGRRSEAAREYTAAAEISGRVQREDPQRAETRGDLALIHSRSGALFLSSGDSVSARREIDEALSSYTVASAADPANARLKNGLAEARRLKASLPGEKTGRTEKSVTTLQTDSFQ